MLYPNIQEEKLLFKKGYKKIAGIDEAGRGPLAGPVVASAVSVNFELVEKTFLKKIKDSKKISYHERESIFKEILGNPNINWSVSKVYPNQIDKINILEATKLAMKRSAEKINTDFLIIDGNFKIKINTPQKSIIKADEKVISVSLASIIAKVIRDKIMEKEHKKYPHYFFCENKGYPTKKHIRNLKKYGSCKIHRKSYKPVKDIFLKQFS